jgi:SHS family lactate transporter-like MFS transporter
MNSRMSDEKHDSSVDKWVERRDDDSLPAAGETPEKMSAGQYIATRFSSLKPPMDRVENPITLLASLNQKQWLFFLIAFLGWTWVGLSMDSRSSNHYADIDR